MFHSKTTRVALIVGSITFVSGCSANVPGTKPFSLGEHPDLIAPSGILSRPDLVAAPTDDVGSGPASASNPDDIVVANGPVATLDLPNSQNPLRTVEIYPTESANQTEVYAHTPLLALETNTQFPIANFPSEIWAVANPHDAPTMTDLTFKVLLDSPSLQEPLIQALQTEDSTANLNPAKITIRPWPIDTISVQLIDPIEDGPSRVYGQSDPLVLAGHQEQTFIIVPVPTSRLAELLKSFSDPVNPPQMIWSYTFTDYHQKYAIDEQKSSAAVAQKIEEDLDAKQPDPAAPIFQDQAEEIQNELTQDIQNTIESNSPDLIPSVSISIDNILKPASIDLTAALDTPDQTALLAYLKPLLVNYQNETQQRLQTEASHENTTTLQVGANLGFGGLGGSFTLGQKEVDELKTENGLTITQSQQGSYYVPYNISVYRRASNYQSTASSIVNSAFVTTGYENVTTPQSPLPVTFTDQEALLSPESSVPYSGIVLGMSFCYFGDNLPPGFVYADGTHKWPSESWVPTQLRNKPIVDMANTVVGGTDDPSTLDTIAAGGNIPIQPVAVNVTSSPSGSTNVNGFFGTTRDANNDYQRYPGQDVLFMDGGSAGWNPPPDAYDGQKEPYPAGEIRIQPTNVVTSITSVASGSVGPISLDSADELPRRTLCRWVVRTDQD